MTRPKTAIVGAGLAGLRLAHRLRDAAEISVFEKSRGFGGRMSTRRAAPFQFDHGAQYMTAHGPAFRAFLERHMEAGRVRRWSPRLVTLGGDAPCAWTAPRYVAVPGMSSLAKVLAADIPVLREAEVAGLSRAGGAWTVRAKDGATADGFDRVLFAIPSVQVARIVPDAFDGALHAVRMRPCFSLMAGLDAPVELGWDAAQVVAGPLRWIALDHAKPDRPGASAILCLTTPDWADANLERPQDDVRADLVAALAEATGLDVAAAPYLRLHRWRFSFTETPAAAPFLLDEGKGLGAAGDWCGTARPGRVEAAFDSAEALADAVAERS